MTSNDNADCSELKTEQKSNEPKTSDASSSAAGGAATSTTSASSSTFKPDMPPPPSPASSTCSDHSGHSMVSPAGVSKCTRAALPLPTHSSYHLTGATLPGSTDRNTPRSVHNLASLAQSVCTTSRHGKINYSFYMFHVGHCLPSPPFRYYFRTSFCTLELLPVLHTC